VTTQIYFVRHGETDSNSRGLLHGRTDIPLTSSGEMQAKRVAARLAALEDITSVYSSPLRRALATAEWIGRGLDLPPQIDPRLTEFDFGDLEGLTFDDLHSRYPELYLSIIDPNGFERAFPNGESRRQLHNRVVEALANVVRQHPGQRVVVVAHLVVIGSAVAHLTSGDPHDIIKYLVRNCSLTHVEVNNTGPGRIHCLDDIAHLE
jgi:broad specificity phosphatase PhoE